MNENVIQTIFMIVTILGAVGLIFIIYSRNIEANTNRLFVLTLIFIIGYIISHSIHFLWMPVSDVTILDKSCHSLLLMIVVSLTFFTWNFPKSQPIGLIKISLIIIPSVILLVLLWTGNLIVESHRHITGFEAHYDYLYPLYLIWYALLIGINFYWLIRKYYSENDVVIKSRILFFLMGLIITNLTSFIIGLFLPWYVGFYFLVEVSPLAFLVGVILFTTVSVGKFNMFPSSLDKLHNFSITKKISLSALILVPIIILLIQIPLFKLLFNVQSNTLLVRYLMLSVVGAIIVSVSIAFVIIKIISNPINRLKEKAQEIEKGNYSVNIDFNTNDEIGELSEAFNKMADTLKNNSDDLKQKEDRILLLLNAFEKSSAAVAVTDDKFRIIEINNQFSNLTGFNRDDIIGKTIQTIQFTKDFSAVFDIIRNDLKELYNFRGEFRYKERMLLLSVTPTSMDKTESAGYLFIEVDITEQKKLEELLLKSEKLAALGKMAAVLAHEIKTPLTSIKMNVDIISESLPMNKDEKENFTIIQKEMNRLNNLVKDVLQFSRQMDIVLTSFELMDFMENIKHHFLRKLNGKNITLINNVKNYSLKADEDKLKQVFINMIDNSIEAIGKDGKIEISTELNESGKLLSIYIKDSGSGIPTDVKIFEPFYTSKTSGTGLGLSVAQKIIEQHNGEISILNSGPEGTTFKIVLPIN